MWRWREAGRRWLTYFKHYSPRHTCRFGDVDGAIMCRVGGDGEDFGGDADGVAMFVFGFEGFGVSFGEGVAAW